MIGIRRVRREAEMFTVEEREQVRQWIVEMARNDPRVMSGAMTGSMAAGLEDRWSDIDLAFGVAEGVDLEALLDDWREALRREFGLLHYWDLPFRSSLYRVFLLPSGLEADVAAVPQHDFGARGPRFRALFGATRDQEPMPSPDARFLIGLGWHHVLHANSSIERGKPWRAEYWISAMRDHTLELACLRLGEEANEARGIDRLPTEVTDPVRGALVRSLDVEELRRSLGVATSCFIHEVELWDVELSATLRPILREFTER
jgi:predicted nucleotidyltransferase